MAAPLIACHECDLLQRETAVPPGGTARCARCDAVLYRNRPDSLNRSLAFAVGAAVFFVIANAFPLVGLEVQGERVQTTLFGAARALYVLGDRAASRRHVLDALVAAPHYKPAQEFLLKIVEERTKNE